MLGPRPERPNQGARGRAPPASGCSSARWGLRAAGCRPGPAPLVSRLNLRPSCLCPAGDSAAAAQTQFPGVGAEDKCSAVSSNHSLAWRAGLFWRAGTWPPAWPGHPPGGEGQPLPGPFPGSFKQPREWEVSPGLPRAGSHFLNKICGAKITLSTYQLHKAPICDFREGECQKMQLGNLKQK